MIVKSEPMELRGVVNKMSNQGKVYYILNAEDDNGTPNALYCPKADALPQGLKKGDKVVFTFEVSRFKGNEKLVVNHVQKVLVEKDR